MNTLLWAEKSSKQMEKILKECKVAILLIGSTEQHGSHLPTGTDHIIAWEIAKRVSEKTGSLVIPTIPRIFRRSMRVQHLEDPKKSLH